MSTHHSAPSRGDLVKLQSSGRQMRVVDLHLKTSEVCVIPADSSKSNIPIWVKLSALEVAGLRAASSNLI